MCADPEFGQVAMMGTMREAGGPILMSLRLRIELGRITEIESVYFKPGGGGPNNIAAVDAGKAEDIWFKTIPPAQRLSRPEMIAVADAYFSGLQKNDGRVVNGTGTYPFTNDCHRIENGSPTTNVPNVEGPFALDCMGQLKMGYYFFVQAIHNRRYQLVDAERCVVWAHCVFDHVTVNFGTLSDCRACPYGGCNSTGVIHVTEAFRSTAARSAAWNDRPGGDVSHQLALQKPQRELITGGINQRALMGSRKVLDGITQVLDRERGSCKGAVGLELSWRLEVGARDS